MPLASSHPGQNQATLQALVAEFRKMDRSAAVAALLRFLNAGRDAMTDLGLTV